MTQVIVTCHSCKADYIHPIEDVTVVIGYRTQTIIMSRGYSFCCKGCGYRNLNELAVDKFMSLTHYGVSKIHWMMPNEPPPNNVTTPLTEEAIDAWVANLEPSITSHIPETLNLGAE